MREPARRLGTVAFVVVAVAAATGGCSSGPVDDGGVVVVTSSSCGADWTPPPAGTHAVRIDNQSRVVAEVELVSEPLVYADLEMAAPGTRATLTVTVPAGQYWWRCTFIDGGESQGPRFLVRGPGGRSARPFVPVSSSGILGAVLDYQSQVTAGLATLATDTDLLVQTVAGGRLEAAQAAWLTAHLDYERLGAAAGTFGTFDGEINGTPFGLASGVDDPHWSGFRRLEYDLWNDQPASAAVTDATHLDVEVHALVAHFPSESIPPKDLALRVHEILENSLQFELTGETDEGSHTNLATARANVDGTQMALAAVAPLLTARHSTLVSTAQADLARLATDLDRFRGADGTWTPVDDLSAAQRERLDGQISGTLEDLAPIPDVLELTLDAARD